MGDLLKSFRSDLVASLRRLAAPANVQVLYLKDLGVYPSADELALEFHELALTSRRQIVAGEISIVEGAAVERLDRQLGNFSGRDYAFLWTADALGSADEWRKVRASASECLTILGET